MNSGLNEMEKAKVIFKIVSRVHVFGKYYFFNMMVANISTNISCPVCFGHEHVGEGKNEGKMLANVS